MTPTTFQVKQAVNQFPMTCAEVARHLEISPNRARAALRTLVFQGVCRRITRRGCGRFVYTGEVA